MKVLRKQCPRSRLLFLTRCSCIHSAAPANKAILICISRCGCFWATYDSSPRRCCLSNRHHRRISTGSGCTFRSCTETARFHTPIPYEFLRLQRWTNCQSSPKSSLCSHYKRELCTNVNPMIFYRMLCNYKLYPISNRNFTVSEWLHMKMKVP